MIVTKLLKQDHEKVKELFEEFESLGERAFKGKLRVYRAIRQELDIHTQIEEELFYPAVKRAAISDDSTIVVEAYAEHDEVKILLGELEELDPQDEQFDAKMIALQEKVEHHVKEEERKLFALARKHLSRDDLLELGAELEGRKHELMGEPMAEREASKRPEQRT